MKATFTHMGYDFSFDDSDVVEARDFIPAGESNPHNVRPWYIHNAGFCLGIAFASCESDALDILADEGKLNHLLVEEADMADYGEEEEGITRCGNAGEPFDLETVDMFALPHVPFSFAALFMAAQADQTVQTEQTAQRFTVEPGRNIFKDGAPYITLGRSEGTSPTEADERARLVCARLNNQTGA